VSGQKVGCQTFGIGGTRETIRQTDSSQNAVVGNDIASRGVEKSANHLVFTISNGYQPTSLNGAFERLMRDSGLLKDADGHNSTLYSLRHTYATLELLRASADIQTLAKQMGNSASVIEKCYSKLTPTMAAERPSK